MHGKESIGVALPTIMRRANHFIKPKNQVTFKSYFGSLCTKTNVYTPYNYL